jgi:RNA-directed DNA polymerase
VSLAPPTKVGQLQKTLHAKAKESPNYRFYALYDKVYRADVLWHAYRICQSNDGSPGVDGQTFDDIEKYGSKQWLDELAEELRMKRIARSLCAGFISLSRVSRDRPDRWEFQQSKIVSS